MLPLLAMAVLWGAAPSQALGREAALLQSPDELKRLSLEELMDIEVTLVSRQSEKLSEAASAIQVITAEDIRRSGARTLPEALVLASNLFHARPNSRDFAITARGFNNTLANKLLVMVDGRAVYTPLYAGVFWDIQHIIIENIERIEVISGPGGALWGANAVNGVINIVTKPVSETRGVFAEAGIGSFTRDFASVRFGGTAGKSIGYRVFGQRLDQNASVTVAGKDAENGWNYNRGGFRAEYGAGTPSWITLHGEMVGGTFGQTPGQQIGVGADPGDISLEGGFMQARWVRALPGEGEFQAKGYFDITRRDIPMTFQEELRTYDFDFHHRFNFGARQTLIWGAGYRFMDDDVENGPLLAFLPADRDMQLGSAFLQDQISLFEDRLRLTVGVKGENTEFSGMEVMPSVRAAYAAAPGHTAWGAVSRAVRAPSRIDVDFFLPAPPLPDSIPRIEGGPDFGSEKLIAYEAGWRGRCSQDISLSVAGFVHQYDDLRIIEKAEGAVFHFTNGLEGLIYGIELSGDFQARPWWRLRGGVTALEKDLDPIPGHVEFPTSGGQGNDPGWQGLVQSFMDLPLGFELNAFLRVVDRLPDPPVPYLVALDLMAAWRGHGVEIDLYGRNLLAEDRAEFGTPDIRQRIPRSFAGRIAWRF